MSEKVGLREKLYIIIFEADTPLGKAFDVLLLWSIVLSVIAVILESIATIRLNYGPYLVAIEWFFTALFSFEYLLRIATIKRPSRYIFSFFGIVDLLAIIPTFLSFFIPGSQSLLVVRGLRLLRIFRIFKLGRYTGEASVLMKALKASRPKITVFLGAVLGLALIMGTTMYLIEGPEAGFTSIPRSVYWAIVTMTTVGYGDLVPTTNFGQTLAAFIMVCGYGILAVPTGIVSVEIANADKRERKALICHACNTSDHRPGSKFCYSCGEKLTSNEQYLEENAKLTEQPR